MLTQASKPGTVRSDRSSTLSAMTKHSSSIRQLTEGKLAHLPGPSCHPGTLSAHRYRPQTQHVPSRSQYARRGRAAVSLQLGYGNAGRDLTLVLVDQLRKNLCRHLLLDRGAAIIFPGIRPSRYLVIPNVRGANPVN